MFMYQDIIGHDLTKIGSKVKSIKVWSLFQERASAVCISLT